MVDIKYDEKRAEITLDFSNQNTMQKIVYTMMAVAFIALVIAFFVLVRIIFTIGMDRSEIMECNKWKGQAQTYDQFFMLDWQKEQCDSQGIFINAPVR